MGLSFQLGERKYWGESNCIPRSSTFKKRAADVKRNFVAGVMSGWIFPVLSSVHTLKPLIDFSEEAGWSSEAVSRGTRGLFRSNDTQVINPGGGRFWKHQFRISYDLGKNEDQVVCEWCTFVLEKKSILQIKCLLLHLAFWDGSIIGHFSSDNSLPHILCSFSFFCNHFKNLNITCCFWKMDNWSILWTSHIVQYWQNIYIS